MENGFFLVHRKLFNSQIWEKPAWWLKVWIYILGEVNFSNGKYPRGSNHFTCSDIGLSCKPEKIGKRNRSVENVIRWLKCTEQITVQKTSRGMVITVCNYERYQKWEQTKNGTEYGSKNGTRTEQGQKPYGTYTLKNESFKEGKKKNNTNSVNKKNEALLKMEKYEKQYNKEMGEA